MRKLDNLICSISHIISITHNNKVSIACIGSPAQNKTKHRPFYLKAIIKHISLDS